MDPPDIQALMEAERFRRRVEEHFEILEMPGTGLNCFYFSIAHEFYGDINLYQRVRQELYNGARRNVGAFVEYHNDQEELLQDIEILRTADQYVSNIGILATALCYGITIVVMQNYPDRLNWWVAPPDRRPHERIIYLQHVNYNHFNVLRPRDEEFCRQYVHHLFEEHVREDQQFRRQRGADIPDYEAHPVAWIHQPEVNDGVVDNHNIVGPRSDDASKAPTKKKKASRAPTKEEDATKAPRKKFPCGLCTRWFFVEFVRDEHVKKYHNKEREFICGKCGAAFYTEKNLRSHIQIQHNTRSFPCKYEGCDRVFDTSTKLGNHVRSAHITNHVCTICGLEFPTYSKLRTHRRQHKQQNSTCPRCQKTFTSREALIDHITKVHETEDLPCPICGEKLKGKYALTKHIKNVHPSVPNQFECMLCGKSFNSKVSLFQHNRNVHRIGDHPCTLCNATFTSASYLSRHMEIVHKEGHFPCEEEDCGAVFTSAFYLQQHMKVHREPQFFCVYCKAGFKYHYNLTTHYNVVHSTEQEYLCEADDSCNKAFKEYRKLLRHQRIVHAKERPIKCEVCDAVFMSKSHLKRHLKLVHGMDTDEVKQGPAHMCRLCDPPQRLESNATWAYHRLVFHPKDLAPGDAKDLDNVLTSNENRIFFSGGRDIEEYVRMSNGLCRSCDIQFHSRESEMAHLRYYHTIHPVNWEEFDKYRALCRHSESMDERKRAFDELYNLSIKAFQYVDIRRKIYDLLIVPDHVQLADLVTYTSTEGNEWYLYTGRLSFIKKLQVAAHHASSSTNPVSTNIFIKISQSQTKKWKVIFINEKYIDPDDKSSSCKEQLKKMEAMDILTLFYFAHHYGRDDVYFQKLEWGQMRNLTLPEITEILRQVENCGGLIWNLARFGITMSKLIDINPKSAQNRDVDFVTCRDCPEGRSPCLMSKYLADKHKITRHNKEPENLTEQLIAMPPTIDPRDIYDLCQTDQQDKDFNVYVVVGSNHKITSSEQAFLLGGEGYIGQAIGTEMAQYHFNEGNLYSGLKKLRRKYKHVYLVLRYKLASFQDMDMAEAALIEIGTLKEAVDRGGISLMNVLHRNYDLRNLFSKSEWDQIYELGVNDDIFEGNLPGFINPISRNDEVIEITENIPFTEEARDNEESDIDDD